MVVRLACGALQGVDAFRVDLEVDCRRQGMPSFVMVGLAEGAVRESRERVFKGGEKDWRSIGTRLLKTYIAYAATMLLGTVLLHFEVEVWGISELIAPIINICITTPINFVTNKFWAFANRKKVD